MLPATLRIRPLDGLRGAALVLAIGYHLPSSPIPGGLVGLDVFFLLSGFLIGGILLEQAEQGRVRLAAFWAGRALRLLPGLALMLAVTGVAAWLVASAEQWDTWRWQLAASAWYGQNFYLIAIDHDYFPTGRATPFVHLWSLGVEEQFYLLLPLLVIAAAFMARRAAAISVRVLLAAAATVACVASFAFSRMVYDPEHVAMSYYDPRSRVYELLAGVVLACLATGPVRRRLAGLRGWPQVAMDAAALVAVAAWVWVAFVATTPDRYQNLGGPVALASGVVLVTACLTSGKSAHALRWPPLVGLGLVSYGVYLWHVPVTELLARPMSDRGLPAAVLILASAAVIVVIAYASWRWVEMPLRQAPRLRSRPWTVVLAGTAGMVALGLAFAFLPVRAANAPAVADVLHDPASARDLPGTQGGADPARLPSCEGLPSDSRFQYAPQHLGCSLYEPAGASSATVLLTGNSVMQSLEPGFAQAAGERGWRLWTSTLPSCPLGDVLPPEANPGIYDAWECQQMADSTTRLVESGQVDVVVALDMFGSGLHLGIAGTSYSAAARQAYARLLRDWSAHAAVVVVRDFPTLDPPGTADFRSDPVDDPESTVWVKRDEFREPSNALIASASEGTAGLSTVSIDDVVCPGGQPCPMEVDGVVMRVDQVHLTVPGAGIAARTVAGYVDAEVEEMRSLPRRSAGAKE